jgi:hypothetical protein
VNETIHRCPNIPKKNMRLEGQNITKQDKMAEKSHFQFTVIIFDHLSHIKEG